MRMDRRSEFTNAETSVLALIDREITRMSTKKILLGINLMIEDLCH